MNGDGTDLTRVTRNGVGDFDPSWSPDGGRIVYASAPEAGNFEIYTIGADGSGPRRLTRSRGSDRDPDWTNRR